MRSTTATADSTHKLASDDADRPSAAAAAAAEDPAAPVAPVRPKELSAHGDVRIDHYYWLNERENPEVIAYLEAENAYTDARLAHTAPLQATLVEEFRSRIKQADESVPVRQKDYYYYTRTEEGKDYPIYARKKGSLAADEEVLLDVNALAKGQGYFQVMGLKMSPDQDILAYAEDQVGRRFYTLRFKDTASGQLLPDAIGQTTGNIVWANDNRTVVYTKQHPDTLRAYQVYRHVLGADPAADELVYEEPDEAFRVWVTKSRSESYLFIHSTQTDSTEVRFLAADDPAGFFQVFHPREAKHEYDIEHHGEHFFIHTNDAGATNFKLMRAGARSTPKADWETVLPHRPDVLLEGFEAFKDHLVLRERRGGLRHLYVRPFTGEGHDIDFGESVYWVNVDQNPTFDTPLFRYVYSSPTTPKMTVDYNVQTREKTILKQDEVLGGFRSEAYHGERLTASAADGAGVPISLVYRRDGFAPGAPRPLLVVGYGAYGYSIDPAFNPFVISLLDRGFVYAMAHVRGGEEMGRAWYDDGRLLNKKNTFTDFIHATEHLVQSGYADPGQVFAIGGSAGGLLMGAIANLRPDLFAGIVAEVPFVDALTTMLDDSIPLTTNEYDEWGDPNDPIYYEYIKSYSPYDNVAPADYPALLVTTGLHDSQVQYWEPAKWVARLRATKTDANPLLLKTIMEAGHGGGSGRTRQYEELALVYAFVLDRAGVSLESD